jgi:molybdate transport system substrate-binding protein
MAPHTGCHVLRFRDAVLRGALVVTGVVLSAAPALAEEITVLCPRGVQAPLNVIAERFQASTGHRVTLVYGTAGGIARRAAGPEPADIVITSARALDELVARGVAATRTNLGSVGVGVAVRKGTVLPDVSTPKALEAALLAAASIGYADPARGGQGGTHFATVIERLGLTETLRARTRLFPEGLEALERVAAGDIALAAAPISEILPIPALALAGPLPEPLQARLVYAAGLLGNARAPGAARAFLAALAEPGAREVLARGGLQPAD